MIIHAIRHLITPWNQQGLLQGRTDIELDLSDPKNAQLKDQLKGHLSGITFDQVVVSPMRRAVQTAIALGFPDHIIDSRVTEMSFGPYEGKPKSHMLEEMQGKWVSAPLQTVLKEELFNLEERIKQFLDHYGGVNSVLLISHGAYIRALRAYIQDGSIDNMNQIEFNNGELIQLNWH